MKSAFGNSCAKGCMVYFVALAAIVAVTMFGLGGLSTRFGGDTQQPASVQSAQDSQQANANIPPDSLSVAPQSNQGQTVPNIAVPGDSNPADVPGQGLAPTPTPMPSLPMLPTQPVQPTVAVSSGTPPESAPAVLQVEYTPLEAQGGVITGGASTPFYVVQPGDTLSDIAQRLGVDVNALVSVNSVVDDLIYPDQVLYLPFGAGGQAPPPSDAQPQPQQPAETPASPGGQGGPANPADVAPTAVGTDAQQVPEMPNTGINKKR
ncbi:MAG: LysM peptidoglycan-binding domain-containing protein [Chloroflexota bacterium]|nr:LysM peptidoglycan-binding domain-containing protein [Chloroflexota bacterium]